MTIDDRYQTILENPIARTGVFRVSREPFFRVGLLRCGMTQIWLVSDLHQEWSTNSFDLAAHAPDAFDVLVVAGDVHTPGTSALAWLAERFPGVPLVYVLGNHDVYRDGSDDRYTYLDMYARSQDLAARLGISLLVDSQAEHAGVRFVGGSLWTDMRLGTHSRAHGLATARKGMRDYARIRRGNGNHRWLRVEETVDMHRATVAYLDGALAVPFDGPTVVVTHHAPSAQSLSDPFMDLRWAYASSLEPLIEARQPALWVHGHLHSHSDFTVGSTRVVANPRGHVEELGTSDFVPNLVLTV